MTTLKEVTKLLLQNNIYEEGFWPGLKQGKAASKKAANKFLLGCILDYQIPADKAWANAKRLAEDVLGNPDNLWERITAIPKLEWNAKWKKYALHRFPKAHERVWRIGNEIVVNYGGDARKIWKDQLPDIVLTRLFELKIGEQISRMIVGALIDTKQIAGSGDVKVDIHVRRVLGRILRGEGYAKNEIMLVRKKTCEMYPKNPWKLDKPLFELGTYTCKASSPDCNTCYLRETCVYYKIHQ